MPNILRYHRPALAVGAIAIIFTCADPMTAAAQNKFDGKWTVNNSSETCMVKRDTWTLIVHNGAVTAAGKFPPTGSISESGEVALDQSREKGWLAGDLFRHLPGECGFWHLRQFSACPVRRQI